AADLNGPTVEHLARAERFQVLGDAIEAIVCRRCHLDEYPRQKSLAEIEAADHDPCGRPLAPAPQVGPGWQDCPLVLHGWDTSASVLSTHSARHPKTRRRSRGANDSTVTVRLDRKRIVEGALALVDDAGLSGLNMRRLAERLGTKPMSLYRHVPSKDALLDAIAEEVLSDVGIPNPVMGDPLTQAMDTLCALRGALLSHPNALPLLTGARTSAGTTVQLDALEALLGAAATMGVDPSTALDALA